MARGVGRDAPTLRRLFGDDPRVASLVAGVAEPAGARNTPLLLAAAGFGRTTIVDMVLRARPETTSAELDEALLRGGIRPRGDGGRRSFNEAPIFARNDPRLAAEERRRTPPRNAGTSPSWTYSRARR